MHSLLDEYLNTVAEHLNPLPAAWRNIELQEIRQHMRNAATVYQEQGHSENQATESVIAQFGPPDDLGESILQTWRRAQVMFRRDVTKAAIFSLFLSFLLPKLLSPFVEPFIMQALNAHANLLAAVLLALEFLLVGLVTGFVLPRRGVLSGIGIGTGIWIVYCLFLINSSNLYISQGIHSLVYHTAFTGYISDDGGINTMAAIFGAWAACKWRLKPSRLSCDNQ